jgi:type I restriction enzyme S subunit
LVGSVGFINQEYPGLLLSDLLYRFQPTSEADGKFLTFFLSSSCGRFQIERDATGTSASMKKVSQETVRHLNVCIPFFDEQSAITAFLDRESAKMDILTSEAQKAITLLQERRSALISAAVTGQIDVRGIQHQEAA